MVVQLSFDDKIIKQQSYKMRNGELVLDSEMNNNFFRIGYAVEKTRNLSRSKLEKVGNQSIAVLDQIKDAFIQLGAPGDN